MTPYCSKLIITIVVAVVGVSIIGCWLFLGIMMLKKVYDSLLSWWVLLGVFILVGYFVFKGLLKLWGITAERPTDAPAEQNKLAPCFCGDDAKGDVDGQKQKLVRSFGKTAIHVAGISISMLTMVGGMYLFVPTLLDHFQRIVPENASELFGCLLAAILFAAINGTPVVAMVYYPVYAIYLGLCNSDFRKAILNYLFLTPVFVFICFVFITEQFDNGGYYAIADLLVMFMVLSRLLVNKMRKNMRRTAVQAC